MEIDLEFEAHDLIDDHQFPEPMSGEKEVGNSFGIDVNDPLPELNESAEPERNQRNGRYNLRKSLAWDSAFFTSAGVLDQDELSSMITGADKSEKTSLPGIQEEITGSTESLSTLESDTLTLEGCEDDLFVDIRASIQRSSKKASNLTNSSRKITAAEIDSTAISSLEKEDCVPIDKSPKLGLKKTSGLQTGRIPKCQPKQVGRLASGKSTKQDPIRTQVASVAKIGEKKSILPKPPKTISNSSIPSSTAIGKRDSMGIGRIKSECGSSKLGTFSSKGTQPSNLSVLSGSRKVLAKPAVPSKSSLLVSASSVHSTRSSTSSDSSTNTSSGVPAKTSIMTARRNTGKSSNISTGSSGSIPKTPSRTGSIPKTPSRAGPRNKLPASTLSAHLMSTKISSSVSPASSISEWSSASSSCSMATRQSNNNSRTSLDITSCKSMNCDNSILDPRSFSAGPTADRHENQGVILKSSTSKKSTTQAGALHAPAKPSGLRMPSPKIGFFDGSLQMKSPAHTPNGHKQSESGLRTATSIPIRSSNSKLKSPKVPTPRLVNPLANIKPASPKPASPLPDQEKSHASDATSILTDVKNSSSLSPGVKGSATGEPSVKAEKVQAEDGVNQVVDSGTGATAIDMDSLGDSSMYKNVGSGDINTVSCEGSKTPGSEYVDLIGNNVLINQDHVKKNSDSRPICEATEKENSAISFTAACRAPFAPKNTSECIDMLTESIVHVAAAERTGFVLPSSEQKENV